MLLATVTGQNPAAGAFAAPVSTNVEATFDEVIQAATATTTNFVTRSEHGGTIGAADAVVSVDGMTITLDPNVDFPAGDVVHVTATAGILGTSAAEPRVWQFRTASSGSGVFADSGQDLGSFGTQFVTFGDADGDGDVDAKEGGGGPLWLNDGTGVFTDSGQQFSAGGELEFGDIDADGDNDIVGTGSVWTNNGSGVFSNTQGLSGGGSVELGDVDGDGDLDILKAGPGYAGDEIWLNNGSGSFTNTGQVLGTGSTQATESADFDGDGDLDFFAVINGGLNFTFLNDGAGVFTISQSLGGAGSSIDLDLGDLDGDGDVDAIVANNPQTSNGSHVFLNDGNGIFVQSPQNLGPSENNWGIELGDLDGDGDLDAFVANLGGPPVSVWFNDGTATFSDSGQGFATPTSPYGVDLADVDGDGDLDAWLAVNSQVSRLWINQNLNPNVSLSVDSATVAEAAGTATITATLDAAFGQDVTIDLATSGTATATDDYTISGTQIVIAAGDTTGSVTVTAVQDDLDEADETVVVGFGSITNGQAGTASSVTVTVTDDDPEPTLTVAVDSASIAEATGVATLTATISAASGRDVTVDLGVSGTATDTTDYTLSGTQIVIPAGSTSGTVTVTAVQDPVDEPDETVEIDVTAVTGATEDGAQAATITIVDDDEPPTVSLAVDNASLAENGGVANFTVTLSAPSTSDVTVDLSISGTATLTDDYTVSGSQIVIPAGDTSGSISVTSVQDVNITEGPETIIVDIDSVTNATEDGIQQATATIIDDVNGPDVTISVDSTSVPEAGGVATITATLTNTFSLPITIDLALGGTATEGIDYTASATQIVVPVGATTGTATITGIDDALIEGDETVVVDVASVVNGNESGDQQGTITITDDETPPTVTLSIDNASIPEEGGVAMLTATLSAVSEQDVTVSLGFSGTAAQPEGFTAASEIVVSAGSTTGTATIDATAEGVDDGDQTVIVDITGVTNGTEDGTQQVTTTIVDDDEAPPIPPGPEPARNSHDVPRNNQVAFNFGANVTAATDQTFVVHGRQSVGQLVDGLTDFSVAGPIASHVPTNDFAPGELINVTVTSDVQLSTGPATSTVWQFRTAATAGSGQFEEREIAGGAGNVWFGDVDGDGDLDAIQGSDLWLNDGDANFTDSGQNVGGGEFADLDGDGDLDTSSGWFNDGNGVFTSRGGAGGAPGDLDGDGDLDLFQSAGGYNGNRVSLNDGNGNFTDTGQALNGSFDNTRTIQLADMDNDGDLDAFTGNWTTQDRVWINDGNANFTLGYSTSDSSSTQDAEIGDFDGDGDNDVLLGHAGGTGTGDTTSRILLNDGNGLSFTQTGAIDPGRTTWAVEVGDMDADGDLDLVIINRSDASGNTIWLNDGNANFSAGATFNFQPTGGGLRRVYGADMGDLNGDGALDVWEANVNVQGGSRIWLNVLTEPQVSLSVDETTIAEAGGVATVTATLSAAHTQAVTIDLGLGGTATDAVDYAASGSQIVIAVGETSGSITITATDDAIDEADETVIVSTTTVTNAQGGGSVTTTITDDDEAVVPTVTLAVDNLSIAEAGGIATFTATLSAATSVDVSVDLAVSGTASAADYTISGTQIVIGAGSTSGSVTVTGVDDTANESDETVIIDIDSVTNGTEDGSQQATTTIADDDAPPSLRVSSLTATSTGFVVDFNNDINTDVLNLFDTTTAGAGPADAVLSGATNGPVAGSLVIGARTVEFIQTDEVLPADTYTVTLRSAADGFTAGTMLLDGNSDGTGGDDYNSSFTIAAPAANAVTVSVPDFVRGPGQPVNIPADETTGLPLTLSEGAGVRNVTLSIDYNPALLSITGADVGAGLPAGSAVTLDTSTAGTAVVTFTSPADLAAGELNFVNLTAAVPTDDAAAIYGGQQVLGIHSVSVTDAGSNALPVIENSGLHVSEYLADVSGNRRVNAADAAQVARVAALIDNGFGLFLSTDPIVIGDVSGNGRINAADASLVAQVAALLPVDQVPDIPVVVFAAGGGATDSQAPADETTFVEDTANVQVPQSMVNDTDGSQVGIAAEVVETTSELGFVEVDFGSVVDAVADDHTAVESIFDEDLTQDLLETEIVDQLALDLLGKSE